MRMRRRRRRRVGAIFSGGRSSRRCRILVVFLVDLAHKWGSIALAESRRFHIMVLMVGEN